MRNISRRCAAAGVALVGAAALSAVSATAQKPAAAATAAALKPRFEVSFPPTAISTPVTGRVFVMISRVNDREPRLQIGRTGVPFFGRDVEQLKPGQPATIDESDLGSPLASLSEIPPGEYYVQAMVNVYSEFKRTYSAVRSLVQNRVAASPSGKVNSMSTSPLAMLCDTAAASCATGVPASNSKVPLRQSVMSLSRRSMPA